MKNFYYWPAARFGTLVGDFLFCCFYWVYRYSELGSNQSLFAACCPLPHSHGYWGFKTVTFHTCLQTCIVSAKTSVVNKFLKCKTFPYSPNSYILCLHVIFCIEYLTYSLDWDMLVVLLHSIELMLTLIYLISVQFIEPVIQSFVLINVGIINIFGYIFSI